MGFSKWLALFVLLVTLPGWAGVLHPPANLQVGEAKCGGLVAVLFDKSADDSGGSGAVTGYEVYARVGAGPRMLVASVPATGAPTYAPELKGLSVGVNYSIIVVASDGTSTSEEVWADTADVDSTPPGPASGVTVTDVPNDQGRALRIEFDASPDDVEANPEVTHYVIERLQWGHSVPEPLAPVTATTAARYAVVDAGLTPRVTYGYHVMAVAPTGTSSVTPWVWASPSDNIAPRPPAWLSLLGYPRGLGTTVFVTWGRSGDDGANADDVASYRLYYRIAGEPWKTLTSGIVAFGASSYRLENDHMVPNQQYEFAVAAFDGELESEWVTGNWFSEDRVPPSPPRQATVTVTDVPNDQGRALRITFEGAPEDQPGGTVTHHLIQRMRYGYGTTEWLPPVPATKQEAWYVVTDTGLVPGATYGYRIKAVTPLQESGLSDWVWCQAVDNLAPRPPSSLTLSLDSRGDGDRVGVTFGRSPDDGCAGQDVVRYAVYQWVEGQPCRRIAVISATGAATYTHMARNLTANVTYWFAVTAMDGTHESEQRLGSVVAVDQSPPGMPSVVAVNDVPDDLGRSLQVAFNPSWDDRPGDREVTHYLIQRTRYGRSTGEWLPLVTATATSRYQYTDRGNLEPNVTYGYRIKAVGPTGESPLTPIVWGTPRNNVQP